MILRYDQGMNTHHDATDHPLTEGRAWDIYSDAHPVDAIRAAFDAGRKYERAADRADLTARLDAERFAHANTAVKVKRVEELADDMDHDADLLDQTDDLRLHLIAATHREDATRLRTALNGEAR